MCCWTIAGAYAYRCASLLDFEILELEQALERRLNDETLGLGVYSECEGSLESNP